MARYRKVDTRVWNDEKFRDLSHPAKLVFFYLLTCPQQTSLGAMRHTIHGMAQELHMPVEAFREAFREALSKGMARHDERACLVWLPNFLKYNTPESPNVVKSWDQWVDAIPECEMKLAVLQRVTEAIDMLGKGFREALPEAFRKALGKGGGSPPLIPNPNPNPNPNPISISAQNGIPPLIEGDTKPVKRLIPPPLSAALAYGKTLHLPEDETRAWFDHFTGNGWRTGKNPVKDWQATLRTWARNCHNGTFSKGTLNGTGKTQRSPETEFDRAAARRAAEQARNYPAPELDHL